MVRAGVGSAVGLACGFALGFLIHYQVSGIGGRPGAVEFATNVGLFVGVGVGAMGAVIGGVGDILAFLRQTLPPGGRGPEADYQDRPLK